MLLPAWGFGAAPAHPRDVKSDSLLAGAGKKSAGSRDAPGRTLAVARLVGCQRVFLDLCAYSNFRTQHAIFVDRTQSRIFHEFLLNRDSYYSVRLSYRYLSSSVGSVFGLSELPLHTNSNISSFLSGLRSDLVASQSSHLKQTSFLRNELFFVFFRFVMYVFLFSFTMNKIAIMKIAQLFTSKFCFVRLVSNFCIQNFSFPHF